MAWKAWEKANDKKKKNVTWKEMASLSKAMSTRMKHSSSLGSSATNLSQFQSSSRNPTNLIYKSSIANGERRNGKNGEKSFQLCNIKLHDSQIILV